MKAFNLSSIGWTAVLLIAGCVLGPGAVAQEPTGDAVPDEEPVSEELELTMKLMPAGAELPDAVTKTIQLPPAASAQAAEASARGLSTANEAKQNRPDGLDTAADARERGREFGDAMAEQARENREDAGRGNPPTPPSGPPDDLPGPPEPPGN